MLSKKRKRHSEDQKIKINNNYHSKKNLDKNNICLKNDKYSKNKNKNKLGSIKKTIFPEHAIKIKNFNPAYFSQEMKKTLNNNIEKDKLLTSNKNNKYLDLKNSKNNNKIKHENICSFCDKLIDFEKGIKFENNIEHLNTDEINTRDYNENDYIKCFECNSIHHLYCIKNLTKDSYDDPNSELKILKPEIINYFYYFKYYCLICLIQKIYPIYKFFSNNFHYGPCYIHKLSNSSLNKIAKLYEVNNMNPEYYKKLKNEYSKKICLFTFESSHLYSNKCNQNEGNHFNYNIIDSEYFFKNRIASNNKKIKEDILNVNFYVGKNFYLKKEFELGKIIDITHEIKELGTPYFQFDFFSLYNKNRNIVFFLCEFEFKNFTNFVNEYESKMLDFEKSDKNIAKLTNEEREMLLKIINKSEISISKIEEKINFTCPFSKKLINIPVRGKYCGHIKCFELKNFLSFYFKNQNNKCPICRKFILLDDLVYGFFIQSKIDEKIKSKASIKYIERIEEIINVMDLKLIINNEKINKFNNLEIKFDSEEWEDNDSSNEVFGKKNDINSNLNHQNLNDYKESKESLNLNKDDYDENLLNINIINNECDNNLKSNGKNVLEVSNEVNKMQNNDIISFDINININRDSFGNFNKKPIALISRKREEQPIQHNYNLRRIIIKTEYNNKKILNQNSYSNAKKGKNSIFK